MIHMTIHLNGVKKIERLGLESRPGSSVYWLDLYIGEGYTCTIFVDSHTNGVQLYNLIATMAKLPLWSPASVPTPFPEPA